MRIWTLAASASAMIALAAAPAQAEWKNYISKDLGFSVSAPEAMKGELGTFRGEVAGPRQSIVFRTSEGNVDYKITVLTFTQAQMDGAALLNEREFMFRRGNTVLLDAFTQVGSGKDTVYGHKLVVDLPNSRTMTSFYFTNGKLYTLEAVLPKGGDYQAPDLQRFVDSIKFDLSRPEAGAVALQTPENG